MTSLFISCLDTRIDESVEKVDDKVADREAYGKDDDAAKYGRNITTGNGCYHETSHAGPCEYGLGKGGSAEQFADLDTENGNGREECVAECMLLDYCAVRYALCPCGSDVVLTNGLTSAPG